MHIVMAALFALHGVAHWVGFVVAWRLTDFEEMPYDTTLLAGRIDVGDVGMRVVGALWLLTGIAFLVVAAGAVGRRAGWPSLALAVAVVSTALSVLGWPDSRIGVYLNLAILALLAFGAAYDWFTPTA